MSLDAKMRHIPIGNEDVNWLAEAFDILKFLQFHRTCEVVLCRIRQYSHSNQCRQSTTAFSLSRTSSFSVILLSHNLFQRIVKMSRCWKNVIAFIFIMNVRRSDSRWCSSSLFQRLFLSRFTLKNLLSQSILIAESTASIWQTLQISEFIRLPTVWNHHSVHQKVDWWRTPRTGPHAYSE